MALLCVKFVHRLASVCLVYSFPFAYKGVLKSQWLKKYLFYSRLWHHHCISPSQSGLKILWTYQQSWIKQNLGGISVARLSMNLQSGQEWNQPQTLFHTMYHILLMNLCWCYCSCSHKSKTKNALIHFLNNVDSKHNLNFMHFI